MCIFWGKFPCLLCWLEEMTFWKPLKFGTYFGYKILGEVVVTAAIRPSYCLPSHANHLMLKSSHCLTSCVPANGQQYCRFSNERKSASKEALIIPLLLLFYLQLEIQHCYRSIVQSQPSYYAEVILIRWYQQSTGQFFLPLSLIDAAATKNPDLEFFYSPTAMGWIKQAHLLLPFCAYGVPSFFLSQQL